MTELMRAARSFDCFEHNCSGAAVVSEPRMFVGGFVAGDEASSLGVPLLIRPSRPAGFIVSDSGER